MTQRTQITLPPDEHRAARRRAAEQGISLAEYVRRLVHEDLSLGGSRPKPDISDIFGLGNSGGSNVARHKQEYLDEAVEADYLKTKRAR
ncbi:MAG TPA: hypothetical protein VGJ71_05405 [Candidatus Limnocylindrales bacterium]|jgi:hypothetical protein